MAATVQIVLTAPDGRVHNAALTLSDEEFHGFDSEKIGELLEAGYAACACALGALWAIPPTAADVDAVVVAGKGGS